ncbi:MAG: sulfatase-like hydrolase/transferase [Desulfamplus sp.]|nr:sulfatase-like hydrolase/transferase [Desulfamplus sp.]
MFNIFKINIISPIKLKLLVCSAISALLLMPLLYLVIISRLSFYEITLKTFIFLMVIWILQSLLSVLASKNLRLSAAIGSIFFILFFITTWIEAGLIHFTGEGFSPAFFYHLNWHSSFIAFNTYKLFPAALVISLSISVLILKKYLEFEKNKNTNKFAYSDVGRTGFKKSKILIYLSIILLSLPNTPIWGLSKGLWQYYFAERIKIKANSNDRKILSNIGVRLISEDKSNIAASLPPSPENLILIFLESMNFQFVNNLNFPNLTPSLNRYSDRFTLLKNHISTENATLPAMISSLCGIVPDYSMGNDTLVYEESVYKNLACFTDILRSAGYYQVYMGGAESSFASKQDFLKQHGYHEIIGWEYWKNKDHYKDDDRHSYWGLYDSDLFGEAINKMEELKSLSPFNFTLLTLNTHLPGFFSNSCSGYFDDAPNSTNSDMLNAIYCSDAALGRYLDWLDKKGFFENTTIVIVGDHKMFNHEVTSEILGDKIEDQRIFGMIHSPGDNLPKSIDERTAPYDIASTIPELLGVEHNIEFSIGQSMLEPISKNRFILDRDMQNNAGNCDPFNIELPIDTASFSPCEYKRLISILDHNLSDFRRAEPSIVQKLERVVLLSSTEEDKAPSIFLDDIEQLEYISKDGIRNDLSHNGIYCVILASDGKVKERSFYDVTQPLDMDNFLDMLENLTFGDWLFMVHKGDILGQMPASVHYLLERMGWSIPLNLLGGTSSVFISRHGSDPYHAVFSCTSYDNRSIDNTLFSSSDNQEGNTLKKELMFDDFKGLLTLISPKDKKENIWNDPKFISMLIYDENSIYRNAAANINICGFGRGASLFSFFYEPVELKRGINLLIFSNLWELTADLNYDFYESDKDSEQLAKALASDTSKFDMIVAVAVHDDAKANLPESVIQGLKKRGAEKIDELEFRSPYLFVFHTKYGAVYEEVGKSGECIAADRGKIIKKVLSFAEKTKIIINEAEKQNNDK